MGLLWMSSGKIYIRYFKAWAVRELHRTTLDISKNEMEGIYKVLFLCKYIHLGLVQFKLRIVPSKRVIVCMEGNAKRGLKQLWEKHIGNIEL